MKNYIESKRNNIIKLLPDITINYNQYSNELIIESNELKPLTINYIGNIQLKVEGDIEIISKGEFDLVTYEKMICLESLGSSIHMNSFMAKSIREVKEDSINTDTKSEKPKSILTIIHDKIQSLENRIKELEDIQEDIPCQG